MTTVLIVKDEVLVREVIQIDLEDAGYELMVAGTVDAAIAILEARTDIYNWSSPISKCPVQWTMKLAACVRDRWPPIHRGLSISNKEQSDVRL